MPENVTITESAGFLTFKGAKGEFKLPLQKGILLTVEGKEVWIKNTAGAETMPMLGTTWALVKNALEGVSTGFEKIMELDGVGYRAAVEGKDLVLHLGYALPVRVPNIAGTTVTVEKNVIKVSGIDRDLVGRVAAEIRALKKPEPYKQKGIHYRGEVLRKKVGKKAGSTA